MEKVKLGTIGSGVIVHSILDNVKRTEGIELTAVYSRSADKAEKLAGEYGCTKTYTDLDAMLADDEINTIYIATPNLLHYAQTKRALLAGKHVITEKPFTTKLQQARELADLAKEKHLMLVEAAPTGFLPNYAILKRELGKIGTIKLVMSNYSQYSSRYDALLRGEKPAIFDPAYAGGCLMDINFYNVLLNVLLFGKPKNAKYYANRFPGMSDTSGTMVMEYDGFTSTNTGAKDTWGVNYFQIEGEQGYIYIENGSNGIRSVRTVTKTSDDLYNEQPDPDRWFYEIQELTRLMRAEDYENIYARLDRTLDTVAVMEKTRKEAGILFPGDAGCVIGIDIGGTNFRIGAVRDQGKAEHFRKVPAASVLKSEDVLQDLADYIQDYAQENGISYDAVAIGFPATLDKNRRKVVQAPNLSYMEDLPVTDRLSKELGVPVYAERDVTYALCFDAAKYGLPEQGMICGIYYGTGIGNAVLIDGKPLIGKNGAAGELGHIPVYGSREVCGCGNIGCMESVAGGKYLAKLQKEKYPDTPIGEMFTKHGTDEEITAFVDRMAMAAATEINILDPDEILIGGGVVNMPDFPKKLFEEKLLEHTRKPEPAGSLRILFTEDEPEKSVMGAALYVRK
ncbi:MAG: allose kinase [Lachnospiraceae bacterium]|nr:allose kinase [Lachnospiraceae bacterium]